MAQLLLIEPDALLARTYKTALEMAGYTVYACVSAQTAVSAADKACPDIVVMELQLVAHNGVEFLYEFRSYPEWQNVPVVILTHVSAGEFAGSWQLLTGELNVGAYLYKPHTNLKKLVRTVEGLVPANKSA
jgi:twitching motility two-component system response regulator PilH